MGPITAGRMDLIMRAHLRSKGYHFLKINAMMEGFNQNVLAGAAAETELEKPGAQAAYDAMVGAETGSDKKKAGGQILQEIVAAITAFAQSDFGKAIIAAAEQAILAWLTTM